MTIIALIASIGLYVLLNCLYWRYIYNFPRTVNRSLRTLEERFRFLRPIEQITTVVFILSFAAFIYSHSRWTLWCFVIHGEGSPTGIIGKSAAMLLTVLSFATASASSAARDRQKDETYLGYPLSTYLISESFLSGILWTPAFKIVSLAVFISPFMIGSISDTQLSIIGQTIVSSKKTLALSLWFSCFITIGLTLLLNMLSLLRQSMIYLLQPNLPRIDIGNQLDKDARAKIIRLFRTTEIGHRRIWPTRKRNDSFLIDVRRASKDLNTYFLRSLLRFPEADERREYFQRTISSSEWASQIRKFYNLKLQNSKDAPEQLNQDDPSVIGVHSMGQIMLGRHDALTEFATIKGPENDYLRAVIVNEMLADAKLLDELLRHHLRANSNASDDQITTTFQNANIVVKEDKLPETQSSNSYSYTLPRLHRNFTESSDSPFVITIVAVTYREVAKMLCTRFPPKEPLSDRYSESTLKKIIDSAKRIDHKNTRKYALNSVIVSIVDALVIYRHSEEELEPNTLENLIPELRDYRHKHLNQRFTESSDCNPASAADLAVGHMRTELKSNADLAPTAYAELLRFVSTEDSVAALLYMLLYRHRSNLVLSADILSPFVSALRNRQTVTNENKCQFLSASMFISESSNISHTLSDDGIEWLFSILDSPISVDLYREFKHKTEEHAVYIDLTNLIVWRVVAGPELSYDPQFAAKYESHFDEAEVRSIKNSVERAADLLHAAGLKYDAITIRLLLSPQEPPKLKQSKVLQKNIIASRFFSLIMTRFQGSQK